jgi:hypothetical protein
MEKQKCSICKNEFPATLDYFGKHTQRGLDTYCKPCRKSKTKSNYYKNKEKWNETSRKNKQKQRDKINEIKNNLSCLKCGETRNHLLDFHHKDPSKKDFQISQGERYGWKKIEKEIKKCIPLCSNCHRDFHYHEKMNNITLTEYINNA